MGALYSSSIIDRCLAAIGCDGYFYYDYDDLKQLFPVEIWLIVISYLGREWQEIKICEMFNLTENEYMTLVRMNFPYSFPIIKDIIINHKFSSWKYVYCYSLTLGYCNHIDQYSTYIRIESHLKLDSIQDDWEDRILMRDVLNSIRN